VYVLITVSLAFSVTRNELLKNYMIVTDISYWSPLTYVGIFASSFSSLTESFIGAPRVFKRICEDHLFHSWVFSFFGKGRLSDDEPIRGYWLTLFISLGMCLYGSMNQIALLVTNSFLITYAMIN